jgi:hypothetical protein
MSTKQLIAITAVIGLLSLSFSGCRKPVDNKSQTGPAPTPSPTPGQSGPQVLLLMVDKTQSASDSALQEFAPEIKEALNSVPTLREIIVVNVGANGLGPWNAPAQRFVLPLKNGGMYDEARANEVMEKAKRDCGGRLNCEERVFREAKERLAEQVAKSNSSYEQELEKTLEGVMFAVLQQPEKAPSCTNLMEMAERIAQTPSTHAIWLSDGEHNCAASLQPQTFNNKVLFALLPIKAETNFSQRLTKLSKTYPNSIIKPVAVLNSQAVLDFLRAG